MKKLLTICVILTLTILIQVNTFGGTVRKVFFDRNLQCIEFEEFASYYRVELHADDPSQPIVYRFYSMAGTLLAEGTATKLDDKDHSKSIYIGENISYFNNGHVAERFVLDSPGPLSSADYYEAYDENNNVIMKGRQKDGVFSGEKTDLGDDGYTFHYFVTDGIMDGEMRVYHDEKLFASAFYKMGIEEGTRVYYHPDGSPESSIDYVRGLKDGMFVMYDENGREQTRRQYKKGVPVGLSEYNLNDPMKEVVSHSYYEMESSSDAPLFISVRVTKNEYTVEDKKWADTRAGNRISGRGDHFNILRYDLYIQNLTDSPIETSIENITILTYNPKSKKEAPKDIYIEEETAKDICLRHLTHEKVLVNEYARDKAKAVATSKTTSYGNRSSVWGSAGYVFGGSRGGWASLGRSASSSSSFSKSFDNSVYYQVFEKEQERFSGYVEQVKQETLDEIERLITSSFNIPANEFISREILASEDLDDLVVLSFTIDGYPYTFTIKD